jgi:hypothetical protein
LGVEAEEVDTWLAVVVDVDPHVYLEEPGRTGGGSVLRSRKPSTRNGVKPTHASPSYRSNGNCLGMTPRRASASTRQCAKRNLPYPSGFRLFGFRMEGASWSLGLLLLA